MDSDGYHLEPERVGSGRTHDAQTWIVANRGRPRSTHCMEIPGLIRRLAKWRVGQDHKTRPANAKGALNFVRTYGFLRAEHGGRENVEFIANEIRVARAVVRAIERKDWSVLERWAFDNASKIGLRPVFQYIEPEDRSELFFAPKTLIDAIYLQALQDVANATEFETCDRPGCPEWFAVGPGTGRARVKRASGRRYCTPKCEKAHAYMRKKGVSK